MKEITIKSSNIKSIFYMEDKKELYVFFKSSHLYVYPFSDSLYNSFLSSQDKDKFFNENVKNIEFIKKF